ncbi:MAG: hypothetical protein CMI21_09965 [Opitutae bacterium]|nr:hypothetical protein [Opitutae bacterium]
MAKAICLNKVTVSGWKGIDERPVEIDFGGESWFIYGNNEMGKSSIFSAIRAALFEYPKATSSFAENWVNNQTPNGAKIELELFIDGEEYTIVKTRGHGKKPSGSTALYSGFGGSRSEISTGRIADDEILELVGATSRAGPGSRDLEQPSQWGVLAWLLAPQGMDSVTPARENGTQTIGLERAVSEEMKKVEEALKQALNEQLTPEARQPKSGGELKRAIEEAHGASNRLSDIEDKREEYTKILEDVAKIESSISEEKVKLREQEDIIDDLGEIKYDSLSIDAEIAKVSGKIEVKDEKIRGAEENVSKMEGIEEKTSTLQSKLNKTKDKIKELNTRKNDLEKRIETNDKKLKSLTGRLKKIDEDSQAMTVDLRASMAEKMRDELNQKLAKLEGLERSLEELMEQGNTLGSDDLEKMIGAVGRFEQSEARLNAISDVAAVSVKIEGELDASWSVDGLQSDVGEETSFAQKMTIEGEGFKIDIARESSEEEDWVEQRISSSSEIAGYSAADADELRKRWEDESKRAKEAESIRGKIQDSPSREEIEAELGKLPDQREGIGEIDEKELEISIEELSEEKEELEGEVRNLEGANEPLAADLLGLKESLRELREDEIATDSLASDEFKRRDTEIEKNGVMSTRKEELEGLQKEMSDLVKARELLTNRRDTEISVATDSHRKARRVKRLIEHDIKNKEVDLKYLKDKAEELGGENLQQSFIEESFGVDEAIEKRDRIQRKVDAQDRLIRRFINALNYATEIQIAPIKDQVEEWLGPITDGMWTGLEMDRKLEVTRITGPARPALESENFGSGGLIQVIHALIRLAVACKIHVDKVKEKPGFPPVALVMDESQGHVDAKRVGNLVSRFNKQIEKGHVQVIALSHRRDEFQNLETRNYDVERREAIDDGILD